MKTAVEQEKAFQFTELNIVGTILAIILVFLVIMFVIASRGASQAASAPAYTVEVDGVVYPAIEVSPRHFSVSLK